MHYEQTDMAYAEYCVNHSDIMDGLTQTQREQFSKYITNYALIKLRKLDAIKDGPFEFKGFKGNWNTGMRNTIIDTNCGDVGYVTLGEHFKTKAIYIQSVLHTAYKDLEYIGYLVREGLVAEWMEKNMPDSTKVFSSDFYSVEFEICRQFYNLGLPIPGELSGVYKDARKYALEDTRLKTFYGQVGFDFEEFVGTGVKLYDLINTNIMNGDVATDDKELALIVSSFHSAVLKLRANGYEIKELPSLPRMEVYRTAGVNGTRLSTIKEIQCMPNQVSILEEVLIPLSSYQMLLAFCWFYTGEERMLTLMNKYTAHTMVAITSATTRQILQIVTAYVYSAEFLDELRRAEVKRGSIFYPETATDEIADITLEEKCKIVYNYHNAILKKAGNAKKGKAFSYDRMAVSICEAWRRYGKLSQAQVQYLNKDVEVVRKKETENYYTEELLQKINQSIKVNSYDNGTFPLNMMETVKKFGRCSMKQARVIEEEYKVALEKMQNNYEDTSELPQANIAPVAVSKEEPNTTAQGNTPLPTQPAQGAIARPSIPSFTDSSSVGQAMDSLSYTWDESD